MSTDLVIGMKSMKKYDSLPYENNIIINFILKRTGMV